MVRPTSDSSLDLYRNEVERMADVHTPFGEVEDAIDATELAGEEKAANTQRSERPMRNQQRASRWIDAIETYIRELQRRERLVRGGGDRAKWPSSHPLEYDERGFPIPQPRLERRSWGASLQ